MAKQKNKTLWEKTRKFLNDIHLWSGLISGIVLLVVCLTGTIYVYNTEIREWNASHLYKVSNDEAVARLSPNELLDRNRELIDGNITGVRVSSDPQRSFQISARAKGDRSRSGTTYFVNPYTGEMLGNSNEENAAATFMRDMFSLHRWLLLDRIEEPIFEGLENRKLGSYITGASTILFTLGVLTGLVIWVPRKAKHWRQGLKIKLSGNWKRINHDLHNTLAFYSAIILFLMGVTGPFFSFPWYREALQKSLGTYKERSARGHGPAEAAKGKGEGEQKKPEKIEVLPLEDYLYSADQVLDYEGEYTLSLPKDGGKTISVSKTKAGFFAPAASDKLVLDVASAEVVEADIFKEKPLNERISGSIKALHLGNVYGSFSKLLYFISCLIATSLPVTGTLIWINKMKKPKKKNKKKAQLA